MGKKKIRTDSKAVIYARYSSHNQRDVSIEQQFEACKKFAAANDLDIIWQYADRAVSGRTDNRPQFQQMLKDAQTGKFSVVIAWKSNRMGRNMLEAMVNDSKLADYGVKCLYVEEDFADTAAGRFALRNMMNVNQFYSENMAEDVLRGMMDNAKNCKVNGKVPLGYRRAEDGSYAIDEDAAAIVREIYQRVIDGWSVTDIMNDLNNRKIKTGRGRDWKLQSFQTLLTNEQYTGVYKFNSIRTEGGIPVIITKDQFETVQGILQSKKRPRGRQQSKKFLLTGKCFCGRCGAPMCAQCGTSKSGKKFDYYMCSRRRYDHACDLPNVSRDRIEKAVLNAIRDEIMNDERIEWIVQCYDTAVKECQDDTRLNNLQTELNDVNTRLKNILSAIEAGVINDTTQSRMIELTNSRTELEREIRLETLSNNMPSSDEVRFNLLSFRDGDLNDRKYQTKLANVFVREIYVFDGNLKGRFNYGREISIDINKHAPDDEIGSVFKKSILVTQEITILNTYPTFFEMFIPF